MSLTLILSSNPSPGAAMILVQPSPKPQIILSPIESVASDNCSKPKPQPQLVVSSTLSLTLIVTLGV